MFFFIFLFIFLFFCIALRGICISVNHCWIICICDVESFSNLYTPAYISFLFFFAPSHGDRCECRERSWPRSPRDRFMPILSEMSIVACIVCMCYCRFSFCFLFALIAGHRASMQPGARAGRVRSSDPGSTIAATRSVKLSRFRSLIYRLDPFQGLRIRVEGRSKRNQSIATRQLVARDFEIH